MRIPLLFTRARTDRGQTLVEGVVAVGVVILVLTAIVSGTVSSLRNARFSRNSSVATQHAQEGLEVLRTIRSRDFSQLQNGRWRLQRTGNEWNLANGRETIDEFTREVVITDGPSAEAKEVAAVVTWQEGDEIKDITLTTILVKL